MEEKKDTWGVRLMTGLLYLNGRLPLSYHRSWARFIAWFMRSVLHYRTDVVMVNLSRSFPHKQYGELRELSKRFYLHFAQTLTEMLWFAGCKGERGRKRLTDSKIVRLTNPEEWNRLSGGARQLVVMHSHMGNWELMGGIRQYFGQVEPDIAPDGIAVTYLPLHNRFWDRVIAHIRTMPVKDQGFRGYVAADHILRFVLSRRQDKFCYVFNTDQYPYHGQGSMLVESFLNQPTRSMTGAAALACRLDMAVCYLRFFRQEDGNYTLTVVPLSEHAGGCTPEALMTQYYKLLEEDLQVQPWNYLWTHKRWK